MNYYLMLLQNGDARLKPNEKYLNKMSLKIFFNSYILHQTNEITCFLIHIKYIVNIHS